MKSNKEDKDYLAILRKVNPSYIKHMEFIKKNVFIYSKPLKNTQSNKQIITNIHSALTNPDAFFSSLFLYIPPLPQKPYHKMIWHMSWHLLFFMNRFL